MVPLASRDEQNKTIPEKHAGVGDTAESAGMAAPGIVNISYPEKTANPKV